MRFVGVSIACVNTPRRRLLPVAIRRRRLGYCVRIIGRNTPPIFLFCLACHSRPKAIDARGEASPRPKKEKPQDFTDKSANCAKKRGLGAEKKEFH